MQVGRRHVQPSGFAATSEAPDTLGLRRQPGGGRDHRRRVPHSLRARSLLRLSRATRSASASRAGGGRRAVGCSDACDGEGVGSPGGAGSITEEAHRTAAQEACDRRTRRALRRAELMTRCRWTSGASSGNGGGSGGVREALLGGRGWRAGALAFWRPLHHSVLQLHLAGRLPTWDDLSDDEVLG